MQLQFQQETCACLRRLVNQTNSQEQTQEVKLPEGMPDIGRVLGAWGQILIRGKEWNSGDANVTGGVLAWVLYVSEDGSDLRSVDTWIPFQTRWEFPEARRDGAIHIWPLLSGIDARCVSARKIMLRCQIGVHGQVLEPSPLTLYTPNQIPEDVQLLINSYPSMLPVEAGEKQFLIQQEQEGLRDIQKLLRYEADVAVTEQRIIGSRLVFRGNCCLHALYCDASEQIKTADICVPFSQFAELDSAYSDTAQADVQVVVTAMDLESDEQGNWKFQCGATAQYTVSDRIMVQMVEDAYSTCRKVEMETEKLLLPARLERHTETAQITGEWTGEYRQVLDVQWYSGHPETIRSGDRSQTVMPNIFQILYTDSDGVLQTAIVKERAQWDTDVDMDAQVQFGWMRCGRPDTSEDSGEIRLRQELALCRETDAQEPHLLVSGLSMGEMDERSEQCPSVILRRMDRKRLWDIARDCGSTVEAIRQANGMESEPEQNQMLLIPVI
jgi:hypothetical protein